MADSRSISTESRSSTPDSNADTNNLTARLDSLLEQYLDLLDQYTTLREELSKMFSAGYFSLAQAQRTSNLGAGRRYGQECYDERMKAQRKVFWSSGSDTEDPKWKVAKYEKENNCKNENKDSLQPSANSPKDEHDVGEDPAQQDERNEHSSRTPDTRSKTARLKPDPATRDPLTWFGILVPPALRHTQAHFIKATEDKVPGLLAIESRLRSLEREIWMSREQLGIMPEYGCGETEAEAVPEEVALATQTVKAAESTKDSRTSRRTLTSRPAHSKSQLLQLGD